MTREDRYWTLFNSLDAGFCVIELAFDINNQPTDYRFVEVNAAFEQQTGLVDAVGKRMRDLAPDHEQRWFDIYGKVALTGEPIRFEEAAEALDHRWFDVHAFRIGAPGSHQVAILFNDITTRRKAEKQLHVLIEELGHRMKNSMALVQAIASQTLKNASDREAVKIFGQRLSALSRAHEILLQTSWTSADLREVVRGAVGPHASDDRILLSGPSLHVDPKAVLSIALLLHELSTNAVKYGALSNQSGRVCISWSRTVTDLVLEWKEEGGPATNPPASTGLGTKLIDMGIMGTSDVTKSYSASGLTVAFRAPLSTVENSLADAL